MACDFQLTLIRHLPTLANVERRYIGWSDESIIPPTQVFSQPNRSPDLIYGSNLRRCQETAALFYPNTPYQGTASFREMNFGNWELKTYEDLKADPLYQNWLSNPETVSPPNGELFHEMGSRVLKGLNSLRHDDSVVVTHGGPIRYMLMRFAPEDRNFWSWDVKHGDQWTLRWASQQCFEEGKRCEFLSVERLMENELM
ncbi:histidine phosphatase family protein [Paenisporosarcina indica]|uniref:histidine phosphatase family protein n=1 Tax=Paenisporosarcina indica TaxID=650093 RepID=UPI00094FD8B3|nr:histidine phosphatase family protein [Paenisporosarcina indica]